MMKVFGISKYTIQFLSGLVECVCLGTAELRTSADRVAYNTLIYDLRCNISKF